MENQGLSVKDLVRENRISKKTGNQYQVLVITFSNDYTIDMFLSNEQQFILADIPVVTR